MDPLSHAVVGRAVVVLLDRRERFGRGAGVAALLGALAPDADAALAPFGWDVYLRAHEIGTHSIVGVLAMACTTAALVRVLTRGSHVATLCVAASAAALSHVALDLMSGARIQVAWPVADWRVTLPLVAMADPWIMAISTAGALAFWARRQRQRTPAALVLCAIAAVFFFKGTLLARAHLLRDPSSVVEARWGSLTEWNVFDRTAETLEAWRVDARDGCAALLWSWRLASESPLVARSRSLDTVRNFLHVHELGFPVERAEGSGRTVFWSDIRFCSPPRSAQSDIACDLWFGAVFGPDGRALTQEVKIGAWVQARAPTP